MVQYITTYDTCDQVHSYVKKTHVLCMYGLWHASPFPPPSPPRSAVRYMKYGSQVKSPTDLMLVRWFVLRSKDEDGDEDEDDKERCILSLERKSLYKTWHILLVTYLKKIIPRRPSIFYFHQSPLHSSL